MVDRPTTEHFDQWLDKYNEFKKQFEKTGDIQYKRRMDLLIQVMKASPKPDITEDNGRGVNI